eukprot:IDg21911t1
MRSDRRGKNAPFCMTKAVDDSTVRESVASLLPA